MSKRTFAANKPFKIDIGDWYDEAVELVPIIVHGSFEKPLICLFNTERSTRDLLRWSDAFPVRNPDAITLDEIRAGLGIDNMPHLTVNILPEDA